MNANKERKDEIGVMKSKKINVLEYLYSSPTVFPGCSGSLKH